MRMIFSIVVGLLFILGLLLAGGGVMRLYRKPMRGALRMGTGGTFMAMAVAIWLAGLNLYTYQRLTAELPVAHLSFRQLEPQVFEARLSTPDGRVGHFILRGDEWQLDARILKWKGPAIIAGMDTRYRLERLSGRYRDVSAELESPRTVIDLAPAPWLERWGLDDWDVDVWGLAETHPRWLPMVDAIYGSATYLRMADQAEYQINVTSSGLIARSESAML